MLSYLLNLTVNMFTHEHDKINQQEVNNDFYAEDGKNDLYMRNFTFMPNYQIELTDQSPENLAKLKQDHVDIFQTVPDQDQGL